ncbi:recombinase family protein [Rufibacter immobilis]|uniref:recombinase family protein n=1 Tax=Rufibacter immobilis TaxID=1348778 RepID=UPI0035EACCC3
MYENSLPNFLDMKIALYFRISTSNQSNDTQKAILVDYAQRNGYEYDLYEEVESSRKTRPVKQQLLAKLRSGEYSGVYVYKLDRWARSSTELILEVTELYNKGVGFVSLSDQLDFSSATGRLLFQLLSCFAEFERSLISDRTKAALQRKKETGVQLGRKPGSKDSKKRETKNYKIREMRKRKAIDEAKGVFKPLEEYIL